MMEKEHQNITHSHLLGIVLQLNEIFTIHSQSSPHTPHRV